LPADLDRSICQNDLDPISVRIAVERTAHHCGLPITKEWKAIGGAGLKKFSFAEFKVSFGMILNEARPEQVQIMKDTIPRVPWTLFAFVGPRAYVKYAARLNSANSAACTLGFAARCRPSPSSCGMACRRTTCGSRDGFWLPSLEVPNGPSGLGVFPPEYGTAGQ